MSCVDVQALNTAILTALHCLLMSVQHPTASTTDYKLNQQAGPESTDSTNSTFLKVAGMYCPDFFFLFSQEPSPYHNTTPKLYTNSHYRLCMFH